MIELTAQGGERVALNPAAVWHIRPAGDQTAIYSAAGAVLFVSEPYHEVWRVLRARGDWKQRQAIPPTANIS